MLLADWAEAINGKLYIQGAGWSRVPAAGGITCAVAVLLHVGWDETNTRHRVQISLVDPDGALVEPEPNRPVVVETEIELGRPPGITAGSQLDAPIAIKIHGLPLQTGRYRFVLTVNDQPLGNGVSFEVI